MKHLLLSALLITGCSQAGQERKTELYLHYTEHVCGKDYCDIWFVKDDLKHITIHKWERRYDSLCAVRDTAKLTFEQEVELNNKCLFWIRKINILYKYNKY